MVRLGISTCLLGEKVRYDGQHKHDRFLTDTLGQYVQFVPVCPEVECGLGVPREAMRLVGDPESPRLVTIRTKRDLTARMLTWAARRTSELEQEELCGYIFKSKSPSSGMERVKVYGENGGVTRNGVGLFARAFMEHFPRLPVEEDGRLHDPVLRENFIERLFIMNRWRELLKSRKTGGGLVQFHTEHKLQFLAHSPKHYRELGQLVAQGKELGTDRLFDRYQAIMMPTLKLHSTRAKHTNVLQHMVGYFKRDLTADEKQELLDLIACYRAGSLPLIVPVALLHHYVRKYGKAYLAAQHYLHPHPLELQLRNHV